MRYLALLLVFVFLLFAAWQVNDPDPVLWIPLYLLPAYVAYRAFQGHFNRELLVILLLGSLAGALNTWLQMSGWEGFFSEGQGLAMKTPNQELAREGSGLAICAVAYGIFLAMSGRKK